jgi:hypothetical protein
LACLVIVAGSLIRSRRRRASDPDDVVVADPVALDERPDFSSPTDPRPLGRRPGVIVAGVVLSGLLGLVTGGPIAGAAAALAVLAALTLSRGRSVPALGAVLVLVLGVAEVVRHQIVNKYLPGSGWPSHFTAASTIVLIAVVLLGADAALEMARRIRARQSTDQETAPLP